MRVCVANGQAHDAAFLKRLRAVDLDAGGSEGQARQAGGGFRPAIDDGKGFLAQLALERMVRLREMWARRAGARGQRGRRWREGVERSRQACYQLVESARLRGISRLGHATDIELTCDIVGVQHEVVQWRCAALLAADGFGDARRQLPTLRDRARQRGALLFGDVEPLRDRQWPRRLVSLEQLLERRDGDRAAEAM